MESFISALRTFVAKTVAKIMKKEQQQEPKRKLDISTAPSGTQSVAPLDLIMSKKVQKDMARLDDVIESRSTSEKEPPQKKEEKPSQ